MDVDRVECRSVEPWAASCTELADRVGVADDRDARPWVEARMNAKHVGRMAKGIALCVLMAVAVGCGASSPTSPTAQVQPVPQPQPPGLQE